VAAAAGLERISRERVRDELEKMCEHGGMTRGVQGMLDTGLFPSVFAATPVLDDKLRALLVHVVSQLQGVEHTLPSPMALVWVVAYSDETKRGMADFSAFPHAVLDRLRNEAFSLRLSHRDAETLVELVTLCVAIPSAHKRRLARRADLYRSPNFPSALGLCKALPESWGIPAQYLFALEEERARISEEKLNPTRLLTGRDLQALGIPAGPLYARLLQDAQDLVVEGSLLEREQALEWLRTAVKEAAVDSCRGNGKPEKGRGER